MTRDEYSTCELAFYAVPMRKIMITLQREISLDASHADDAPKEFNGARAVFRREIKKLLIVKSKVSRFPMNNLN